jgi:hypothetical protein
VGLIREAYLAGMEQAIWAMAMSRTVALAFGNTRA